MTTLSNTKKVKNALEALRFVINDSHGAIGSVEVGRAKSAISERAMQLINLLDVVTGVRSSLVADCESQIDRATGYVNHMNKKAV